MFETSLVSTVVINANIDADTRVYRNLTKMRSEEMSTVDNQVDRFKETLRSNQEGRTEERKGKERARRWKRSRGS